MKDISRNKHVIIHKGSNGKHLHIRRNMWGRGIMPGIAYQNFKDKKSNGEYHPNYTWKQCCQAYRKKVRKMKIAKLSRKGSNKRVKKAR